MRTAHITVTTVASAPVKTLMANGGGDLFVWAVTPSGDGLSFVDDAGSGPSAHSLGRLR